MPIGAPQWLSEHPETLFQRPAAQHSRQTQDLDALVAFNVAVEDFHLEEKKATGQVLGPLFLPSQVLSPTWGLPQRSTPLTGTEKTPGVSQTASHLQGEAEDEVLVDFGAFIPEVLGELLVGDPQLHAHGHVGLFGGREEMRLRSRRQPQHPGHCCCALQGSNEL